MLREDFDWFVENYDTLHEQYGNGFLAIKNKTVLGVYPSYAEGVKETQKTEELGTFIVQECNGSPLAYNSCIASTYFMGPSTK